VAPYGSNDNNYQLLKNSSLTAIDASTAIDTATNSKIATASPT
jgi:hypothetical protein